MKFLLDENVHRRLFTFLVKLGHDVKLSPKSIKNGEVFGLSSKEERILITRDSDFLDNDKFPLSTHFGILLLRIRPKDIESQKLAMSKLLKEHPNAEEFNGKVVKIFSDKDFEFL